MMTGDVVDTVATGHDAAAVVGRTLAREAVLLARICAPEDAEVARRLARALRDPERVRAMLAGLGSGRGLRRAD